MEVCGQLHVPEKAPCIHWRGGWVGLRAGLDTVVMVVKREIPAPARNQTPVTQSVG